VQLRVAGPVSVLPQENADVRARVEGIVEEVYVDEGDQLAAGDRIARLSSEALTTSLRATEADIKESHAILQRLQAGPTRAEIAVSRAAVASANDRALHARNRLARVTDLYQAQALTRAEFDDVSALATTAENDLNEARRRLDLLLVGTRPEMLEAERARLERLEANRKLLEEQVSRLDVTTPVAGIVATPSRQLRATVRQLIPRGGLIARVYDFKTMSAQVMIAEKFIADIKVGQRVELRTRALPNVTFHGKVTQIAIAADGLPANAAGTTAPATPPGRNQNFIVTTQLENESLLLKPGMSGQAKVFCGDRRIASLLTRRIARTLKVEVWSWW
jgi:HlyD family secretion protein